jgi:hypothetical protein
MSSAERKKGIQNFNITMLHRKLSDTEGWQAIGLIKAGIKHRRVDENFNFFFFTMN